MTTAAAPWYHRAPSPRVEAASRWSLILASVVALAETAVVFGVILDGRGVPVPRWDWYAVAPASAVATLVLWGLGTVALAHHRTRVSFGWLLPVGAVAAALLDRQTLAGEIIYLVVVMSAMHWWSVRLAASGRTADLRGAPLRICQIMITVVFAWATYAKLNPRFMSGAVLSVSFTGPIPVPDFVLDRRVLTAMAVITVVAEAFLAVAFWARGLRRVAVITAVMFHLFIVAFFMPTLALLAFSFVMGTGYVLFAGEPWPRSGRLERGVG
jgi:hypothetical protein